MPDTKNLRVGDRIRLLRVPEGDLKQREREIAAHAEMAGWTADTIEQIIATNPVVTVCQIDEFGDPWYEATLIGRDGQPEEHSLIIYDDDTWEIVGQNGLGGNDTHDGVDEHVVQIADTTQCARDRQAPPACP